MKNLKRTNFFKKGNLLFIFFIFLISFSCQRRAEVSHLLLNKDLSTNVKDTIITLDTVINKLDTIIIDTNYHDLLTFDVQYDGKNLPTDTTISLDNGTAQLDFSIESDGEDWQYFKANSVNWISEIEQTDGSLKLAIDKNTKSDRSAYLLLSLNKYPAKYKLIKITQKEGDIPEADLLDVVFNSDGTAEDISSMDMEVTKVNGTNDFTIKHNDTYDLNIVQFDPSTPGILQTYGSASYYRIDYGSNTTFQNKVADGFSMEALAKVDYDFVAHPVSSETKIFGSIYGGGYSLMIRTDNGSNNWAFQINLDKYRYYDGMTPNPNQWYHLIGVWDKDAGWVYFYINGQRVAQSKIGSALTSVSNTNMQWIAIGGNAGIGNGGTDLNNSFKGSIGIVRMYDKPLTANEVQALWSRVDK